MPLDIDRVSEALLTVTRAMVAKELAPLRAANADLLARNSALEARLAEVEARDVAGELRPMIDALSEQVKALPGPVDVSGFVTKGDIPPPLDTSDFARKADVDALRAEIPPATEPVDTSVFATKGDLDVVRGAIPTLSGFAEWLDVERAIADAERRAADALSERAAEIIAAIPAVPDTVDFVTVDALAEVREAIPAPVDTSAFALRSEIPQPKDYDADIADLRDGIKAASDAVASIVIPDRGEEIANLAARLDELKMPEVIHGRDGAGIAEMRQNADGELIVKITNGETHNVGKIRGADGFNFDDLRWEFDGERTVSLVAEKDGRVERKDMKLPVPIYRGVWKEGAYERGDCVTWAGSQFTAMRDTEDKPETSDAWRLSTKKGRDGRPGALPAPKPETVKR